MVWLPRTRGMHSENPCLGIPSDRLRRRIMPLSNRISSGVMVICLTPAQPTMPWPSSTRCPVEYWHSPRMDEAIRVPRTSL